MALNPFDVVVIGAGVSGLSAAYDLADAGLKVLVVEKEKLPRYKTCGGGVVLRAANMLPFSISSVVQREIKLADVFDQENKIKFRIERNKPVIFMTMRSELDYFLLSRAVERGALVIDKNKITGIISNNYNVGVITDKQKLSAKIVIACDGATGLTMTQFNNKEKVARVPALESEFFVDSETLKRFDDVARFDFGFIPHGYGWVFPKKNHLSLGIAFMRHVDLPVHKWFDKYLRLLEIKPENVIRQERHGYVIPLVKRKLAYYCDKILFAGDNLGLVDPLTAEGISYAIETGKLAAKAIITNNLSWPGVIESYKQSLNTVYREIKSARLLSRVVYGPMEVRKFIFKNWGNHLSELLTDVITGENKYSNIVRNPINLLKFFRLNQREKP